MESFSKWIHQEELKTTETTDSGQVAGFSRQLFSKGPMNTKMYPEPVVMKDERIKRGKNLSKLQTI